MCNPAFIIAATVASSALSAFSYVQQGNAARQQAEFQNAVARQNAAHVDEDIATVHEQSSIEKRRLGVEHKAAVGDLRAKFAAMGLTEFGTYDDLKSGEDQAYRIDQSILNSNELARLRNLDQEKSDYLNQGALALMQGKSAQKAGYLGAAGSLLDGVGNIAGKWMQPGGSTTGKTRKYEPLAIG